ncbi:MAG: hypothetical protein ACO3DX_02745 [Candidatus Nanopelagicales bacterium]|jgi:hypothetical protein
MPYASWISSTVIAVATSTIAVFLSSVVYQGIPAGSILAGILIIIATRYIRTTHNSFWQSTLVIICWGLITFRAATPTAMGDLILIEDDLTWWYVGITGVAAFVSLIIPTRASVAKSPDEVASQS